MEGDPYGFRQPFDIVERSLSPAVNEPTAAVHALDAIHDLLRRLTARPFPSGDTTTRTVSSGYGCRR